MQMIETQVKIEDIHKIVKEIIGKECYVKLVEEQRGHPILIITLKSNDPNVKLNERKIKEEIENRLGIKIEAVALVKQTKE